VAFGSGVRAGALGGGGKPSQAAGNTGIQAAETGSGSPGLVGGRTRLGTSLVQRQGEGGPGWLTVREAAALLRVSTATVYRMVEEGQIPSVRVSNLIRIPEAAVPSVSR